MRSVYRQGGVSLLELVVVIVILGVVGSGMLILIQQITASSADPQMIQQANAIARAYLEEVMSRSFCDPEFDPDADPTTACPLDCTVSACTTCGGVGPLLEGSRGLLDDICDYHGLSDSGAMDQTGAALPGLAAFNVTVDVDDTVGLNGLSGGSGQVVLVNVNVTHTGNSRVDVTLSAYRANF